MKILLFLLLFLPISSFAWDCDGPCRSKLTVSIICEELRKISVDEMDVSIVVEKTYKNWIRFSAMNKNGNSGYGYMLGKKLIVFGSAIEDEYMDELKIPKEIR